MQVKIKLLENGLMPKIQRKGDACFDCHAVAEPGINIAPGERTLVGLGFCLELPDNYEAVIRPRSGLSKQGIDCAIGTIDSNYRGELKVCVINNSKSTFYVKTGDRICQLAIRKTEAVDFSVCDNLSGSDRGEKGFGSSGI